MGRPRDEGCERYHCACSKSSRLGHFMSRIALHRTPSGRGLRALPLCLLQALKAGRVYIGDRLAWDAPETGAASVTIVLAPSHRDEGCER
jgi:hypothetical protein